MPEKTKSAEAGEASESAAAPEAAREPAFCASHATEETTLVVSISHLLHESGAWDKIKEKFGPEILKLENRIKTFAASL